MFACSASSMHACMYIEPMYGHTCSKSMDQPGKVANNPARGQLKQGK